MNPPPAGLIQAETSYRVVATSDRIVLTRHRPAFLPGGALHAVILLILAAFPFQWTGLDVGTSKFDVSNILFYSFSVLIVLNAHKLYWSGGFKLFFLAYLILETIEFLAGPATLPRFASAFVCLTSILVVFGARDALPLNARLAFRIVLIGVALLAASLVFEYVVQGEERPAGLMAEPSVAGLVVLGTTAGLLLSARWAPGRTAALLAVVGAGLLFAVSFVTRSTHVLSFVVALTSLGFVSRSFNLRTVILGVAALTVLYWLFTYDPHYQGRINVADAASNLSLLSWLQGFDQMVASFQRYPLVGAGLGGTGQFDFYSPYSAELAFLGLSELNRQDAFSGLFRLTIELGPVLMGAVLYSIAARLTQLWRVTGAGLLPPCAESQAQIFLFVFAFTLVFGVLLKEPTYSRSHFVVAALLFSIVPLRAVVDVPLSMAHQLTAAPTGSRAC